MKSTTTPEAAFATAYWAFYAAIDVADKRAASLALRDAGWARMDRPAESPLADDMLAHMAEDYAATFGVR